MEIIKIARTKDRKDPIKVYATVKGDSGNVYNVSYTRRGKKGAGFRGWVCSCPNFALNQIGKNGHCKHIDLIQKTYGRYASRVGLFIPNVGDTVFISKKVNEYWTGKGLVEKIDTDRTPSTIIALVRMTEGKRQGVVGGFYLRELAPVPVEPTA